MTNNNFYGLNKTKGKNLTFYRDSAMSIKQDSLKENSVRSQVNDSALKIIEGDVLAVSKPSP